MSRVSEKFRILYNKGLYDLCWCQIIVKIVKSRILYWVGHIAKVGETRITHRILVVKLLQRSQEHVQS